MSRIGSPPNNARTRSFPPLVSANDISEGNYPRARFDESIAWTIKETAQRRAPTAESVWFHQVGFAGELATAAYLGVEADWTITEPFVGDDGFDLCYQGSRIEVKTVTDRDEIRLTAPHRQLNTADYYVLAMCSNPTELVQLIGYTSRAGLEQFGYGFRGDPLIHVDPENLYLFEPIFITPERIRESQSI